MTTKMSVNLEGSYYWRLVFSYDNSTNDGPFTTSKKVSTRIQQSSQVTREELTRQLQTSEFSGKVSTGFQISMVSTSVEASYGSKNELENELKQIATESISIDKTVETEHTWVVGPKSKSTVYQLVYSSPGDLHETDTYVTNPASAEAKNVVISYIIEPESFITGFKVKYGTDGDNPLNDKPDNAVTEYYGKNNDINAGFGGNFVWLVPEYTTDATSAPTSFNAEHQSGAAKGYDDLAKGAGGDFRYIFPLHDGSKNRVKQVYLLRSSKELTTTEDFAGFKAHSQDINAGRGGDFLYLVWNPVTLI